MLYIPFYNIILKKVDQLTNGQIDDVKIWAGSYYRPAANASYRNLFWENLPTPDFLFHVYTPNMVSLENFQDILVLPESNVVKCQTIIDNYPQVTVPRYRENRLITPFSMLCAGISQNTRLHHLTVAKGHVRGKSYHKICDNNILNIAFDPYAVQTGDIMEQNGELYVPPTPGWLFRDDRAILAWESEMLQSFAELTHITNITFHSYDSYDESLDDVSWQVDVGNYMCINKNDHEKQCVSPYCYFPWYMWTKEGGKIQIKFFKLIKQV